jgi:hypothetical protein
MMILSREGCLQRRAQFFYDPGSDSEASWVLLASAEQESFYINGSLDSHWGWVRDDSYLISTDFNVNASTNGGVTWSVWSLAPPVHTPEPSSRLPLVGGVAALGIFRYRKV